MLTRSETDRLNDLRARLVARVQSDGSPKKGYVVNVQELKAAIRGLEMKEEANGSA